MSATLKRSKTSSQSYFVACECNVNGSKTLQCDPENGQCECMEGITGQKCDRCDRGTTGMLPNCVPCGECFDNWDNIIQELKSKMVFILQL